MDGLSFNSASSSKSWSTATEIVGHNAASFMYGEDSDHPPNNRDWNGEEEGPQGGVSVVLIETSEMETEG